MRVFIPSSLLLSLAACADTPREIPHFPEAAVATADPDCVVVTGVRWCARDEAAVTASALPASMREVEVPLRVDPPQSLREQMLGSWTYTSDGTRWEAVEIEDEEAVLAKFEAAQERMLAEHPGYMPAPRPDLDAVPEWDEGAMASHGDTIRLLTWSHTDCDSDSERDMSAWDTDDRDRTPDPMSAAHRRNLLIEAEGMESKLCTAVLVDSDTVLTAAHCVVEGGSIFGWNLYDEGEIEVCSYGNHSANVTDTTDILCAHNTSITFPSGYTGAGNANDYALVHLDESFSMSAMPMFSGSAAEVEAADSYNVGYPGFEPDCDSNQLAPTNTTDDDATEVGMKGWRSTASVINYGSSLIKTYHDAGAGESGSAIYYYPTSSTYEMTGIMAGFVTGAPSYTGGPSSDNFSSWVTANM